MLTPTTGWLVNLNSVPIRSTLGFFECSESTHYIDLPSSRSSATEGYCLFRCDIRIAYMQLTQYVTM